MANTILTPSKITYKALDLLENSLGFTKGVNRNYDDNFAVQGAKIGDTLNIRKPAKYAGRSGAALASEDHTETSVALQLDTQFGVDVTFSSKDLTLSMDDFSDRVIKPAMSRIANEIDRKGMEQYKHVYNAVGTPGTVPTDFETYLEAGALLDEEACPTDLRHMVIGPRKQLKIVNALKGLFQSSEQIAKQYEKGVMGIAAGFQWKMDQNEVSHVNGALGGTPAMNGATTSGATSIVTDGWTAAAANRLKQGDVFTIANVYAVNPVSGQSTGQLRKFVVTADVASDGSGNATIPISPAIISTGAFKTVNAVPVDGALLTVLGAASAVSPTGLAYHKDAFVLGCADLYLPKGVDMAARASDKQLGISIRMVRQYDINSDNIPCRFDVLFGWKTVRPELAVRIQG